MELLAIGCGVNIWPSCMQDGIGHISGGRVHHSLQTIPGMYSLLTLKVCAFRMPDVRESSRMWVSSSLICSWRHCRATVRIRKRCSFFGLIYDALLMFFVWLKSFELMYAVIRNKICELYLNSFWPLAFPS